MTTHPEDLAKQIEALRHTALCDVDDSLLGPMSEQHYLLAIAALEQAQRYATLASYHLMRKD